MNIFTCSIHHFDPRVLIHKSSLTHLVPKIKSDIQKKRLNIAPTLKIFIFWGKYYFMLPKGEMENV